MGAIVLGYDASPGARSALDCAVDLASEYGDDLVIVYGVEPPGGVGEEWKENLAALEDQPGPTLRRLWMRPSRPA